MVQQVMLVVLYLDGKPITTLISLFLDIDDELNMLGIVNHSELLNHEIHKYQPRITETTLPSSRGSIMSRCFCRNIEESKDSILAH